MWHHVAALVDEWGEESTGEVGLSSVGAVVGATHPRAVADARRLMPRTILLLPGVGAQGASVADLARAFQSGPASALVSASRSVIYAYPRVRLRFPGGGGRRGGAAQARNLGRLRLVVRERRLAPVRRARPRSCSRSTIAVVLIRSGMDAGSDRERTTSATPPSRRRRPRRRRPRRRKTTPTQRFWTVQRRRHLQRHLDEVRHPGRDDRPAEPESVVDLALHRREDPAQVRRLARPRRRARAGVAGGGARRRRRRSTPAPGSSRTRAPARCSHRRTPHAHLPIASITKLMTVLLDARAPQADRRRRPSTRARRPSASRRRPRRRRAADRARPDQGGADPVGERRRRRARALGRARLPVVRGADEREGAAARAATTRTSCAPTASTRPATYSSAADVTKLARIVMRIPFVRDDGRRADRTIAGGRTLHTWDDLLSQFPRDDRRQDGAHRARGLVPGRGGARRGVTVYATLLGSPSRSERNDDLESLLVWGLGAVPRRAGGAAGPHLRVGRRGLRQAAAGARRGEAAARRRADRPAADRDGRRARPPSRCRCGRERCSVASRSGSGTRVVGSARPGRFPHD